MAYDDHYRLSTHAVITNNQSEVLLLRAAYGDLNWGLPGGALDPGETVHEALIRECLEELSCRINIKYLSGVYYHSAYNSHAFIFRCEIREAETIGLSEEHTDYKFMAPELMADVQRMRVVDCLNYSGVVVSAKF